jgi:hypothetical protein
VAEDVSDLHASDPQPGKLSESSFFIKVNGAHPEPLDNDEAKSLVSSAESEDPPQRSKKGRKQAVKKAKGYQPKLAAVEENCELSQEAGESERVKSMSRKRPRPLDATCSYGGNEIHNGSTETLRKRTKAPEEEETTAVKKIKRASEKPVKTSGPVILLTHKLTSKKRSQQPEHEDPQLDCVAEKPRKRMKHIPTEKQPTTSMHRKEDSPDSIANLDQGVGNARTV